MPLRRVRERRAESLSGSTRPLGRPRTLEPYVSPPPARSRTHENCEHTVVDSNTGRVCAAFSSRPKLYNFKFDKEISSPQAFFFTPWVDGGAVFTHHATPTDAMHETRIAPSSTPSRQHRARSAVRKPVGTHSEDPALSHRRFTFLCAPVQRAGVLRTYHTHSDTL